MKKIRLFLPLLLLPFLFSCAASPAEPTAEEILLEKAQQFHDLMRDYLNYDEKKLAFTLGSIGCDQIYLNVVSDTLTDYLIFLGKRENPETRKIAEPRGFIFFDSADRVGGVTGSVNY